MQQNDGGIVQASSTIARNSTDTNLDFDDDLLAKMPSDVVQSRVAASPDKATLKVEVSELQGYLAQTQMEAETYLRHIKVRTADKAKALFADQRAGFQKAAKEHEALSKDTCQAEVAQTEAWVIGQAESVISQKDAQLNESASNVNALRSHLGMAQQRASREAEHNQIITVEA